jgi:murein DD-endopeptidase MepM/ murein hydrolase activator NlpD
MNIFYTILVVFIPLLENTEGNIFNDLFKMSDYNTVKYYNLCQKYGIGEFAEKTKYYIPNQFPIRGGGVLKSDMGMRMHPIKGIYKMHNGIDLVAMANDTIYSSMNGFIKRTDFNAGYGLNISVVNEYGFESLYAHCSELLVEEGENVTKNTPIAIMGRTGLVTGKHLHYELRLKGVLLNPLTVFEVKERK